MPYTFSAPGAQNPFNEDAESIPTTSGPTVSPSCIPTAHSARTLVLCFDGTGDQFDADNSNVVQLFSLLKKDDRRQQMVYYQAGIGTYTAPSIATPFAAKLSKTLDEMIACNLDSHVMDGYEFLMQNYEAGDKICIFGFSRGAYTARALAGMVHKVGLLPACNHQQIPFAYKMYTRTSILGWKQSTLFKKTFSMDVDIEFIGVWDTVCSVGLFPRRLPFTASNTSVKTFRHAVSLDERRAKFRANLYNRPQKDDKKLGTQPGDMPKAGRGMDQAVVDGVDKCVGTSGESEVRSKEARPPPLEKKRRSSILSRFSSSSKRAEEERYAKEMERQFSEQEPQLETNVLEVWFAGCHCDVGGGSVSNDTRHNLARIPLRWMIRQCFLANTGIRFHAELLRGAGIDPASLHPVVQERPDPLYWSSTTTTPNSTVQGGWPTEEEEDLADALSPIYDQLSLKKGWWCLEFVPMRHRVQLEDDSWAMETRMNRGRGRVIPLQECGFNVHRSVKIRMEVEDLASGKYVPKAKFDVEPTWVS